MVVSFTAPTGMITAIYIWAILQIVGCYQIYCRPTFGFAYNYVIRYFRDSKVLHVWSLRPSPWTTFRISMQNDTLFLINPLRYDD